MKLTLLHRLKICAEVLFARSGHSHCAQEKQLSVFKHGYEGGIVDKELELSNRICRTENTLQQYAKYATREAMDRDIRLIGGDSYESVYYRDAEKALKRVVNSAPLPDSLALINVINVLCASPTENNIKWAKYAAERATLSLDIKELRRVWKGAGKKISADSLTKGPYGPPPLSRLNKIFEDSLNIELEKLELKDGDILIVKYSDAMTQADLVGFTERLIKSPAAQGKKDLQMILVAGDMDIKSVDEKDMNEAGWFKMPKGKEVVNYYYRCPEDQFEWESEHSVSACPKCNAINKSIYHDREKSGMNPPVPMVILLEGQKELKGDSLYSRRQV